MKIIPTILIVDDEPINLTVLSQVLTDKYQVRAANSGERALEMVTRDPIPDLILLDVMMPDMNGYEVLTKIKSNPLTCDIPVIFVTAMNSTDDEEAGLEMGAVDYIGKPIIPAILLLRVKTQLLLQRANVFLKDKNEYLEKEIKHRMAENLAIQNVTIKALAHLAETRDPETGNHILRTQSYIQLLAKRMQKHPVYGDGISDQFIDLVTRSAPLHDIGKVGTPDNVLLKPGKLNGEEWEIMKTHSELGERAITLAEKDVEKPLEFLSLAKEIARSHHEKWDGSGYPDGLAGHDIPLSARLMAIADVFDALTTKRVYKDAMPYEQAKEIIIEGRGKHFDPEITDCFLELYDDFVNVAENNQEE